GEAAGAGGPGCPGGVPDRLRAGRVLLGLVPLLRGPAGLLPPRLIPRPRPPSPPRRGQPLPTSASGRRGRIRACERIRASGSSPPPAKGRRPSNGWGRGIGGGGREVPNISELDGDRPVVVGDPARAGATTPEARGGIDQPEAAAHGVPLVAEEHRDDAI